MEYGSTLSLNSLLLIVRKRVQLLLNSIQDNTRKLKVNFKQFEFQSQDPSGVLNLGKNTLISSPEGWFPPFTVSVNSLATIVATQSLQLGAVSANTLSCFSIPCRRFSRNYRCCCFRNFSRCSVFILDFFQNGRF